MKSFFRLTLAVYVSFLAGCQCTSCFRGLFVTARTQCTVTHQHCCPQVVPATEEAPQADPEGAARPQFEDAVSVQTLPIQYDRPQLESVPAQTADVSVLETPASAGSSVEADPDDDLENRHTSRIRRTSGVANVPADAAVDRQQEESFPSDVSVETPQKPTLQAKAPRVAELPPKVEIKSVDPDFGVPQEGDIAFSQLPEWNDADADPSLHEDGTEGVLEPALAAADDQSKSASVEPESAQQGDDLVTSRLPTPDELQELAKRPYYRQPEAMLRLRAVTPVGQHSLDPNQATILMRDTLFVGGRHLLETPDNWGRDNLGPGVAPLETDRQVREALQRLTPSQESLRR